MNGGGIVHAAVKTAIENLRLFQFDKAVKRVFCQGAKKRRHMKGFFIMLNHQGCHVVAFGRDVQKQDDSKLMSLTLLVLCRKAI